MTELGKKGIKSDEWERMEGTSDRGKESFGGWKKQKASYTN